MTTTDSGKALNDLLALLHDSQKGYAESASAVSEEDLPLKRLLQSLASQRQSFINELVPLVAEAGTTPTSSGTALGALHRIFVDLVGIVTGEDADAVVAEIRRGETTLIEAYQTAVAATPNPATQTVLRNQLGQVEQELKRVELTAAATP